MQRPALVSYTTPRDANDLVRLGPENREVVRGKQGIWCRAKKTRRKRRSVFIPLSTSDALELDRWASEPMAMTWGRWERPIPRHRTDLYLYSPKASAYTPTGLRACWGRWLAKGKGKELCDKWRAWLDEMVRRYEWDIDPEDTRGPTIHGLRGTGILLRFTNGYDVDQIANDIGASQNTIQHYMRFRDQMEVAALGAQRLRLAEGGNERG